MKIGLFTDTYLPNINGVVTSVEMTRKKLEELNHEVYVFCSHPGLLHIKQEDKIISLPGIELKKLYGYSLAHPVHPLMMEKIRELHLDVIHCHTEFGVGLFGVYCAKFLHIPLVKTYHTTYEDYTHYINPFEIETLDHGLKYAINKISKFSGNDCTRLISPSLKTKDLLLSYGISTPIDIIPTGIEIKRFSKSFKDKDILKQAKQEMSSNDKMIFLYVGRIAQEKSLDMLIDAFKMVKENNLKAKLCIIGKGPQEQEIINTIDNEQLNEYISFLGSKPNDQIPAYYQSADCFISASTSETQGLTYIEALSSGLLVLGRDDEVVKDLVNDNENGFIFDNGKQLYEKINIVLNLDKDKLKQMKENALNSAKEYDADLFVEKILDTYTKAMNDYNK